VVKEFLHELKDANFRIEKAFLFGSHARGNPGKWSDIDVALVSPDFSGMPFYDNKKLTPFILKVDTRIELHPFRPEDFTEDNDNYLHQIEVIFQITYSNLNKAFCVTIIDEINV
jgi:predicted nucleotidyltransferase